ncbi:hypothetical protein [Vogesella indigofera]|uniref:Vgr related protein n=1 Tax=Vogesella indigofera TaxID=45465 RepID=A0ABT5I1J6_VOGIN|nr:hypothetical protein [Vogesella indigofera]MDC7690052.1 hypothetical protein [Vogesella indigofera]
MPTGHLLQDIDSKELRRLFEAFVVHCLSRLVDQGFVTANQINQSNWYVLLADDNSRLVSEGFLAGTSLDNNQRPYIVFDTQQSLRDQIWAIPHEAIHLAQICKGDFLPCWGYSLWKGRRFEKLAADHPKYFEDQPWEKEARALEDPIRKHFYQTYPDLRVQ